VGNRKDISETAYVNASKDFLGTIVRKLQLVGMDIRIESV